ncbi:tetratricopeptide repeat protein [Ureibacillus sp. FSL K6-8385]|uniref:tetratricopeptide repeat protein n=1 Tax=Ureibacillus TaxID=160795 RepID=UPI002E20FDC0|nr:tetratricopeptide repeat protein [Ureibacillus terrenus]
MNNITQDIIQAIEGGEVGRIDSLLETLFLKETPEVQYEIYELLLQYGYIQQAKRVLEHLRFLFPDEAQISIDYASVLIELGEEDEALDILFGIDPSTPEYPQCLLLLADYYQMQGLYEAAEKRINEALELLPDEPLIQFAKAELLYETGRFPEAARIYENLHKKVKEIAGVLLAERLAEVYRAGGGFEKALDYYMEALEEKVTADLLYGSAYSAFQCEKYETAIRQLEDLKELDPDYFSSYLLLAQSYAMLEDNEKAYSVIKEGIKRDEYEKSFYLFAGKIALKNKLPEEAIEHLKKAVELDPEYMEAILVLMSVYHQMERYDDIIELYEKLEREQFEWVSLSPFVADAFAKNEQYDRAYEIYKSAYNELKDDPSFLENYCYFLIEDGKREEAREVVQRLIELQPTEIQWLDLLDSLE